MRPRVLHFNDCAFVARSLVSAAERDGLHWLYMPPRRVRPTAAPRTGIGGKATYFPFWIRRIAALSRVDVVHVHYGTSARLLRDPAVPRRPYVLTLHGSDIRRQWKDPRFHDEIQRAVDEAAFVFYANADNVEDAVAARSDAEFLPSVIDLSRIPHWTPDSEVPRVLFVSRWDADKGVDRQLELAAQLVRAVGPRAEITGLDWGPGAENARRSGVKLLPRMAQSEFHRIIANSHVAVGQASNYFSTSEFEALSIGLPMAALGHRLPRPDDGSIPPVMEGSMSEVIEQIVIALDDPVQAGKKLGGAAWARPRYDAAAYVPRLQRLYTAVAH